MQRIVWLSGVAAVAMAAAGGASQAAAPIEHSGGWVGKTAAGFTLPDQEGKQVDVGKVIGTRPVVLIFYRGVW